MAKAALAEKPNISNKDLPVILKPYVVDKFRTHSLLNMTKRLVRLYLFGDPAENVTYLPEMVRELENAGHDFEIVTKNKVSILKKVEEIILTQHIVLMKADGAKLLKQDKIDFIEKWCKENKALLMKAGLGSFVRFIAGRI